VATDTGHQLTECSNGGLCNRRTGVCDCFDSFTGNACQRLACPASAGNPSFLSVLIKVASVFERCRRFRRLDTCISSTPPFTLLIIGVECSGHGKCLSMENHAKERPNHALVTYGLDGKSSLSHVSFHVDDDAQDALESATTGTREWYQYNEVSQGALFGPFHVFFLELPAACTGLPHILSR
jgi:hypothetical protein